MPFSDLFGLSTASRLAGDDPDTLNEFQTRQAKQRIADALIQKGLKPIQGQMAGRFYVGPSWAEGAAQMASAGLGGQLTNQLGEEARDRAGQQQAQHRQNVAKMLQALEPEQEQRIPQIGQQSVDPALVPPTFDIDQLQPDVARAQRRDANATQYAMSASPREVVTGALTEGLNSPSMNPPVADPQQGMTNTVPVQAGPDQIIPADNSPENKLRKVQMALLGMNPSSQKTLMPFAQMAEKQVEMGQQQAFNKEQKDRELAVRREGIQENARSRAAQIEGNILTTQMLIDGRDRAGQDSAELKKQLASQNAELQKTLHEMDNASRERVAEKKLDAKTAAAKPLPASSAKGLLENHQNLRMAEQALALASGGTVKDPSGEVIAKGDKSATGMKGMLPEAILQRVDPKGVDTRAAIANLGSLIIHDRSGAAVTASEFPRLKPFIPKETDDNDTVQKKLKGFVNTYRAIQQEMTDFFEGQGYVVPTDALQPSGAEMGQAPASRGGVGPYSDPEKERAYQEWKKSR